MGWRDTIKSRSDGGTALVGSFRGARFIVPSSDAVFGRRTELHEYPQRDIPWVEDTGKKARQFSDRVFVDGRLGDYLAARDSLIAAIEEKGPGTLVHPYYGTMTVSLLEPAQVRESTYHGGRASFRLVFVESGELRFPSSGIDTALAVSAKADTALTECLADYSGTFSVDGLPGWCLTELADDLYTILDGLEDMVSGVSAVIAAEIRSPANMGAAIIGSIKRLSTIASEPLRALSLYKRLFSAGDDRGVIPVTTAIRQQQEQNTSAMQRLVRQTALIEACRSSSVAEYQTRDDALSLASTLLSALDDQMATVEPVNGEPISDDIYQAMAGLRASVATDLRTRGARLPYLSSWLPLSTMPALVAAHLIYGDATRADEITSRNGISHPGFVPGGTLLEILEYRDER